MNGAPVRLREILNKAPLGLLQPVFYAIFFLSILLYVAFLPLSYLYGLLLCPIVWIEWGKQGKDVLVILAENDHSRAWMARLSPLISNRAVVLNWSERKRWDRWSLRVQLFEVFGPHGMPEQFTEFSLPSVVVFRQLRRPKKFTFGARAKDLEARLEQLSAALELR
jgi:hypothetical protein